MSKKNEFDLNSALDTYLFESRNGPKDYVSKPGIKPSELASPCLRKNYYVYHKVPGGEWPLENILAADAGDAFHGMVRKHLKSAGLLIEHLDKNGKVPVSFIDNETPDPEFPMYAQHLGIRYAKADGLIMVPEGHANSGLWVLEIKSKKPDKFKKVHGPDRDVYQGNLYVFLLEEQLREGKYRHIPRLKDQTEIQGSVFVYVDRGTGERKIYWQRKDEALMGDIIAKCVLILDYAEKRVLPPKTQDFCPWCNWKDKCDIEWNVEK